MCIFKKKEWNKERDRIFLSVLAVIMSLYTSFSCTYFASAVESVRESVVRLHVIANSDSAIDQAVKLKVRDALLKTNTQIFSEDINVENAKSYFEKSKEQLKRVVESTLLENGFLYPCEITMENEYFETREYGTLVFPAGEYLSLKVVLGDGNGKNWWCVMFPPLCVPVADGVEMEKDKLGEYLTPSGQDIVKGKDKYIFKFKILEIYEEIKQKTVID